MGNKLDVRCLLSEVVNVSHVVTAPMTTATPRTISDARLTNDRAGVPKIEGKKFTQKVSVTQSRGNKIKPEKSVQCSRDRPSSIFLR